MRSKQEVEQNTLRVHKMKEQHRSEQSGGTKKVNINTEEGFDEILKEGKTLFFPE